MVCASTLPAMPIAKERPTAADYEFADHLRNARISANLTLAEVAMRLARYSELWPGHVYSHEYVRRMEQGMRRRNDSDLIFLMVLCDIYGITMDSLIPRFSTEVWPPIASLIERHSPRTTRATTRRTTERESGRTADLPEPLASHRGGSRMPRRARRDRQRDGVVNSWSA